MSRISPLYLYNLVRNYSERFAHIAISSLRATGVSQNKRLPRRLDYYSHNKVSRKTLHVFNKDERRKVSALFVKLLTAAKEKNPKATYFPMDRVIRAMYKREFHIVRFSISQNLEYRVPDNNTYGLLFRRKNELLIIRDDYVWKPGRKRTQLEVWKIECSDDHFTSIEKLLDLQGVRGTSRWAPEIAQERELEKGSMVVPKLLLRIAHRPMYLDSKHKKYYLKQIASVL